MSRLSKAFEDIELNDIREIEVDFEIVCGYSKEEARIAARNVIKEDNNFI